MAKRNRTRDKAASEKKSAGGGDTTSPGKRNLTIAVVAIICAIVLIAAAFLFLNPGAGGQAGSAAAPGGGAAPGDQVSVDYTGMFVNGTVFDTSINKTPISFTIGSHQVIPGFENAIVGMVPGQTKTVDIPVEQAYGPYNPEKVLVINRTNGLETMDLTPGEVLTYRNPSTNTLSTITVVNFTDSKVTIDTNHALAGLPLRFTVHLVSISKAPA